MSDTTDAAMPLTPAALAAPAARNAVPARSWLLLAFLTAVYSCNWMDRYLMTILIEPMKLDLHLSDTQLGIITGFAFSVVYSLTGLPIARLVDRGPRRFILFAVVASWSGATMLTSLVRGFSSLGLARLGVAVAESGCSPTAYSLISDSFPRDWRGRAVSIYSLGISIGVWAGLMLGGVINDMVGWRATFILVGLPGIVLALIGLIWVRDPVRGGYDTVSKHTEEFTFRQALRRMSRSHAFIGGALSLGMITISTGAFEGWAPTYLIRSRHLSTSVVGTLSGSMQGIAGTIATLLVGALCDRLGRRDPRWYLWLPLIGVAILIPSENVFFRTSGLISYVFYFGAIFAGATYTAPMFTLSQILLPPRMRALGAAVMLVVLNLVGMGGGVFGTGLLSDMLQRHGNSDPLGNAILLLQVGGILGAATLIYAAFWIRRDLKAVT